jgi:hypothetical protein
LPRRASSRCEPHHHLQTPAWTARRVALMALPPGASCAARVQVLVGRSSSPVTSPHWSSWTARRSGASRRCRSVLAKGSLRAWFEMKMPAAGNGVCTLPPVLSRGTPPAHPSHDTGGGSLVVLQLPLKVII